MNIPWSYKSIPEIKALPKDEQAMAWKSIFKELSKDPRVRRAQSIQGCIFIGFIVFAVQFNQDAPLLLRGLSGIIIGAVGGLISSAPYLIAISKHKQSYIDDYLHSRSNHS